MAEITAALVKQLRETTGAGMMDCKKALTECGGDLEASVDWLRKAGMASAAKKASRVAAEGLVAVQSSDGSGAIVEINAETDFVARNEQFQDFVRKVVGIAAEQGGEFEKIRRAPIDGSGTVEEAAKNLVGTIGENISLRRSAGLNVKEGIVASYIHNAVIPEAGRIGVLVGLESAGDKQKLMAVGRQLAMHVAAASPQWNDISDVDPAALERERTILTEQAKASGRPDDIVAKMVEGRMRKFYEETVLLEQVYVIDNESKVRKVVEALAAEVGAPVVLKGFVRFVLGEGVERKEDDFAAEVAAAVKG